MVRLDKGIEPEVFPMAGTEQIDLPHPQNAALPVHADLTRAGLKLYDLIVALDARAAVTAGLVANLAKRDIVRPHTAVVPGHMHAIVVISRLVHSVSLPAALRQLKPLCDAGYDFCDSGHSPMLPRRAS